MTLATPGRLVFVTVVSATLLALAALALKFERAAIVDRGRLEAMASRAIGLHVRILGHVGLAGIPGDRITADDVHATDDRGVEILSAKRVRIAFEVTVAAIDANGCTRIRQQMHGSFAKPEPERPRLLGALASPVLKLVGKTRNLLPGHCEPFYSGSVAPPGAGR